MKKSALSKRLGACLSWSQTQGQQTRRRQKFLGKRGAMFFMLACLGGASMASGANMKPQPSGIYDLLFGAAGTGVIDLTDNPLLDNPNVDGYRYKVGWAKIQPDNASTFKWDSIDSAIAIAAAHGKKLCISIAGGLSTPGWVYTTAPIVYKYDMIETDPDTGLSIGSQPLVWDTTYQNKWQTFVAAFAARYESNPACSYVVMGGFMQTFNMTIAGIDEDFNAMEDLAKNPPPGYPGLVKSYTDFSSAYIPAAQWFITDYINAFPTTSLLLTLYRVVPGDLGITLQDTIGDWGKATYPAHFGTMVSALYATVPPHTPPPAPLCYPKGFQMVCRATDDPARLYLDPDPVPMPPFPTPLEDALEHGVSLGAKYIEVYEEDLTPASAQPVLAVERAKLLANVGDGSDCGPPGPPAPPTGLHVVFP